VHELLEMQQQQKQPAASSPARVEAVR